MSDQDRISPYNIKQTNDENKEKYQIENYKLIKNQILQTNITRTVWQTVRKVTEEILGVKGGIYHNYCCLWTPSLKNLLQRPDIDLKIVKNTMVVLLELWDL